MRQRFFVLTLVVTLALTGFALLRDEPADAGSVTTPQELRGLRAAVRMVRDSDNVPHVFTQNDHDGMFMIGYLHAQDRLFQMDVSRRLFSGTLAELVGQSALPQDIQLRTLGLRRAAERSVAAYSARSREYIQAYADGVNAFLGEGNPLPPEYAALELTQVEPWTLVDTLTVAKGLAFGLSFDLDDLDRTQALMTFQAAGQQGAFDGTALFFEDTYRVEPLDGTVSIPEAGLAGNSTARSDTSRADRGAELTEIARQASQILRPETLELVNNYLSKLDSMPALREFLSQSRRTKGSNWWIIGPENSATGNALFANDPHLALDTPATFYETHLEVAEDPALGAMNVAGVTFPGAPNFVQGCNEVMCWGSTVNPLDVTDVFQDTLVVDFSGFLPEILGIRVGEEIEEVELIGQAFRVNDPASGTEDDLSQASVGLLEGGLAVSVPRRNDGPIVDFTFPEDPSGVVDIPALSVQFTGWSATREGEAFFRIARSRSVEEFREALQFFDFGSQNFGYADIRGNIAYFTSAEMPLREDLQAGTVAGLPPFFIRDGTGAFPHEWIPLQGEPQPGQAIPFEILPFDEMPQLVNPARGWIANANNDPLGVTLDNNPLNQLRGGGGILYLSPGYTSPRVGRIARVIDQILNVEERTMTIEDMKALQGNNALLDAELFTPFILQAWDNLQDDPALPESLQPLASDAGVGEAVERLRNWAYSSPTGIQAGYDPGDDPDNLPVPSQSEIDASIATTIYSTWRGQFVRAAMDIRLEGAVGPGFAPPSEVALAALLHHLESFDQNQGIGASGINFFETGFDGTTPQQDRDAVIIAALRDALGLLASDTFASAFGESSDQDDYRWGRLHRIVFNHPLGGPFSIPEAGGFSNLDDGLPGVARAGGFQSVDASSHSARSDGPNEFMFGSGPARRFVGDLSLQGIAGEQIIPGGQTAVLGTPDYAGQMARWLTNQYHELRLTRDQVESAAASEQIFVPRTYDLYFPFLAGNNVTFTSFAAANNLSDTIALEVTAWSAEGGDAGFPVNPFNQDLESGTQIARLSTEFFGLNTGDDIGGWIEMRTIAPEDAPQIDPFLAAFTQIGNFGLTRLDGGLGLTEATGHLFIHRVFSGPTSFGLSDVPEERGASETIVRVVNPGNDPVQVTLHLTEPDGMGGLVGPPSTIQRMIPGKGLLAGTVSELFDIVTVRNGLIEVIASEGGAVAAMALVTVNGDTAFALNAVPGNGSTRVYSAQFAVNQAIVTELKVTNITEFPRRIRWTLFPEDGPSETSEIINLAPGASFAGTLRTVAEPTVASLEVNTDGPGVIGDVVFWDDNAFNFAAAMPLQARPFHQAIFGHVANVEGVFFTGLALFNTGPMPASIEIAVFGADGEPTGNGMLMLNPGARTSQTLAELAPGSGQQSGGFIIVTSDQPLVGQELFGTSNLSLQSAVPPLIVR
ncbi:MAG TPA: penicillin acylase family protein [Acidobacteriota bacterium]|nr:penicillin acylase family protein [Acidobacteriota bacterium]